jgi:kynurenine formamidase
VGSDHVLAAVGQVRLGEVHRLDLAPDFFSPPLFGRPAHRHTVQGGEEDFARDDLVDGWNTQASSHWDGLRHVREDGGFLDGRRGAELGSEHLAAPGLVTRAVLADVARWRDRQGRPLDPAGAEPIPLDELVATLADQGTDVVPGDVLLVNTGWVGWYAAAGGAARRGAADRATLRAPGLAADPGTAGWLWDRGVVAIAADNPSVEVWPLRTGAADAVPSLHVLALVRLGIVFGELWDLRSLAASCAADGRWESMIVSAPLGFPGACAAPANAIAIR